MTHDIKALLLEAAELSGSMHTSRGKKAYPELTDKLRAAAASMGEPVAEVISDHADGFGTGEYQAPSMDGLEPGTKLYLAPPPPAVPECPYPCGWEQLYKLAVDHAAYFAGATLGDEIPEQVRTTGIKLGQYAVGTVRSMLTAPEHPKAGAVPDECPHMIVFDDTEVKPMLFAGCGARDAAMKAWENACISWTAHLFVRVAASCKNDPYPSATLATSEHPKAGAVPAQVMGRVCHRERDVVCFLNSIGRSLPDGTPLYSRTDHD